MLADEILSTIIRATVMSARVKNSDIFPISLFLVAPIENGKTTLAIRNAGQKPLIVSDVSGIGLLEALFNEKSVTHVIINDLMAVTGHKSTVSKLTISVLNALAEEGCYKIALPRMQHLDLQGRKVGVIACCTPELVNDQRQWWSRSGFASRVLMVRFQHSISLQVQILQAIANGTGLKHSKPDLKIPEAMISVKIGDVASQKILLLSREIAHHNREVGYRREKQLRALACGLALLRTWRQPSVSRADLEFIEKALPFFMQGQEI